MTMMTDALPDAVVDDEEDYEPGVPAEDPEPLTMAQLIQRANEAQLEVDEEAAKQARVRALIPRAQTYGRGAVNSRAAAHKGQQAKRVAKDRARRKASRRR